MVQQIYLISKNKNTNSENWDTQIAPMEKFIESYKNPKTALSNFTRHKKTQNFKTPHFSIKSQELENYDKKKDPL